MGFSWDDLNPVHDAEQLAGDAKSAWNEVTTGANTAPTPQVHSSPPAPVQAKTWNAPDVSGGGHITVHHGALTSASDVIKGYLQELYDAINEVNMHSSAFDSLMSWDTGSSFGGNLVSAVTAFAMASEDTSNAHAIAANNLTSTATTYGDTETTNAQMASGSSGGASSSGSSSSGSSSSGPASASSGNWG